MKHRMKFALGALLCAVQIGIPLYALAQSAPSFFTGQVPTAANWQSYFALKADVTGGTLVSPTMSGTPVAPTATGGTATTQIATTAFVDTGFPKKSNNLSDLASATTARTNLGLGTIATQAASAAAITGGTLTGVDITAKTYRDSGTITASGSANSAYTRVYLVPSIQGSSSAGQAVAGFYLGTNDNVMYFGGNKLNNLMSTMSLGGASMAGNRSAIFGQTTMSSAADPGDDSGRNYTAVTGRAAASANNGGYAISSGATGTGPRGALFGGVFQASLSSPGTFWEGTTGLEIDMSIAAGASARNKRGFNIVTTSGDAARGAHVDSALLFTQQGDAPAPVGWRSLISVGGETHDAPTASDTTLFNIIPRKFGGSNTIPFAYGIDLRLGTITAGGAAFASPNHSVTDIGAVYGNGLTSNGTVRAQTATLTGVTITSGGEYLLTSGGSKPTFAVQAPPSGGTTATVTTATMGGVNVRRFGATGRSYIVGDVLTIAGGTGTSPTLQVATVDGSGGITSVTIASVGALTAAPANPVSPTGGSGTGAAFYLNYNIVTATFQPALAWAAATGRNYLVGDALTIAGDTGTATVFAVSTVDAFGGITAMAIQTVGSLTAIGGAAGPDGLNYHAATGGAGSGASLGVTYKVLTTIISNAGAGYLPLPLPVISPSLQADYFAADLLPAMTAVAATLALNPAGGAVQAGGVNVGRFVSVPGSSSASCVTGDFSADASYIYACRAANLWTRSANVGGW